VIKETHEMYHGEKVAFGTLVQLVLENADMEEIEEVLEFCQAVGLPTTLSELGIQEVNQEEIMEVARLAAAEGDTLGNMPFAVTAEDVYAAIMAADALGRCFTEE
jgi:glycerol dehydrogenase